MNFAWNFADVISFVFILYALGVSNFRGLIPQIKDVFIVRILNEKPETKRMNDLRVKL